MVAWCSFDAPPLVVSSCTHSLQVNMQLLLSTNPSSSIELTALLICDTALPSSPEQNGSTAGWGLGTEEHGHVRLLAARAVTSISLSILYGSYASTYQIVGIRISDLYS